MHTHTHTHAHTHSTQVQPYLWKKVYSPESKNSLIYNIFTPLVTEDPLDFSVSQQIKRTWSFPFFPTEHNRALHKRKNIQSPTVLSVKVWQMESFAPGSCRRNVKNTWPVLFRLQQDRQSILCFSSLLKICRYYYFHHSLNSPVFLNSDIKNRYLAHKKKQLVCK